MNIFPVIMAGGKGERFWPYSNQKHPKQLLKLVSDQTMLEDILDLVGDLKLKTPIHIIASQHIEKPIEILLNKKCFDNVVLVGEPENKNTVAAIALASRLIHEIDPEGVMVVLTADHAIKPKEEFIKSIQAATQIAKAGKKIVTFGITPTRPDTGYGYIEVLLDKKEKNTLDHFPVKQFHEKPNQKQAQNYLNSKKFFWNSGMFVWRIDYLWFLFKNHLPNIYTAFENAKLSIKNSNFKEQLQDLYPYLDSESIDYGIMEKASNIEVVIPQYSWDDMGSWLALERLHQKNSDNNTIIGDSVQLDTSDSLIFTDNGLVATYGVKDLIVIQHDGVTLVIHKKKEKEIKKIIEEIKNKPSLKKFL